MVSNATMPEQYISIVIPGRMYSEEYKKMGLTTADQDGVRLAKKKKTAAK